MSNNGRRLIAYDELRPRKGIRYSRMHLGRLMDAGLFPRKIKVSARRIAWIEEEVDAWIEAKFAAREEQNQT